MPAMQSRTMNLMNLICTCLILQFQLLRYMYVCKCKHWAVAVSPLRRLYYSRAHMVFTCCLLFCRRHVRSMSSHSGRTVSINCNIAGTCLGSVP